MSRPSEVGGSLVGFGVGLCVRARARVWMGGRVGGLGDPGTRMDGWMDWDVRRSLVCLLVRSMSQRIGLSAATKDALRARGGGARPTWPTRYIVCPDPHTRRQTSARHSASCWRAECARGRTTPARRPALCAVRRCSRRTRAAASHVGRRWEVAAACRRLGTPLGMPLARSMCRTGGSCINNCMLHAAKQEAAA